MARMHTWIALAGLGISLTGCVSAVDYKALRIDRDLKAEQLADAERSGAAARSEADAYKQQVAALMGTGTNRDAVLVNSMQQLATLQSQYDQLRGKYLDALRGIAVAGAGALPPQLSDALASMAQQNPDLIEFDAARGIVKFKSDVTFAVGDAALSERAREVINRFAQIVNSPAASGYELLVAGHTDNQPVRNPATIRKGHKDNWYLSAHRAISVAAELMHDRVDAARIGCAGYADQRPVASNDSEAGRAQNRRVEVVILPTTVHAGPVLAADRSESPTPAPAQPVMNKDGGGTIPAVVEEPQMNK